MKDTREDAGEFYPGGKIVTPTPRRREDPLPLDGQTLTTNTIPAIRDALRRIGTALGAAVSCIAVAFAAEVQTIPVNEINFDQNLSVVTNVTGLTEMSQQIATNAMKIAAAQRTAEDAAEAATNAYLNATNYTDGAIAQIPAPDFSPDNEELVETIEEVAPMPDLSPFLRNDKTVGQIQTFGGMLKGKFLTDSWYSYTVNNPAATPSSQTLPLYVGSTISNAVPAWARAATKPAYTAAEVGAWPAVAGSEWGLGSAGLTLYLESDYLSGTYCFGWDSEWHVMRRLDVEAATNATLAAAMAYTDSHTPDIGSAISNAVPAWARAASKPTYTAAEVGAYSTGDVDYILLDYLPLDYFKNGQTIPMYMGDGTKLCDFGANWLGGLVSTVGTKPDAADIPPAVSNTVTTVYVREKLGVWMEYDEETGIYYYCHEEE